MFKESTLSLDISYSCFRLNTEYRSGSVKVGKGAFVKFIQTLSEESILVAIQDIQLVVPITFLEAVERAAFCDDFSYLEEEMLQCR